MLIIEQRHWNLVLYPQEHDILPEMLTETTHYFSGLEDHDIYHIHQEVQQLFLSVELTRLRLQPHVLRLDVCPQKYALQVQQSFSQYVQAIRER